MSLITPGFGLFFWMVLAFVLLVLILKKFAWKPILGGLSSREAKIAQALDMARLAQEEVEKLHARNVELAREAQLERERMVAEAQSMRSQILSEAQDEAKRQAQVFLTQARQTIEQEEVDLRRRLRAEVVDLTIRTSERILREHFQDEDAQRAHISLLVGELQGASESQLKA